TDIYSQSVDIWAIGVITMELVLDHPFLYASEQREYTDGRQSLGFDDITGITISELCQDFIKGLLAPNPQHRLTAKHAILHGWFATVEQILEHEDSQVTPTAQSVVLRLAWSSVQLQAPSFSLSESYIGKGESLSSHARWQGQTDILSFAYQTKFFVMRSDNEADMEICLANDRWIGLRKANVKVDNGYRRSGGNVVIFFGVSRKRRFCGVARMLSAVDQETTDEDWMPRENGEERFEIEWLTVNELHFDLIQHIPARLGKQRKAVQCMDGFELAPESGYELLRVYTEVIRQNPTQYGLM
ncbi:Pkinase-domain-containing protein, partial [Cadophora sp. DSE1049]